MWGTVITDEEASSVFEESQSLEFSWSWAVVQMMRWFDVVTGDVDDVVVGLA